MKKIITAILVLVCVAAFLPAAFAGETENHRPWFQPTLKIGVAFDAEPAHYKLSTYPNFLGYSDVDLKLGGVGRPHFTLGLPLSVTDRLTVSLNGDWSFTSSDKLNASVHYTNLAGTTILYREYDTDGTAHWLSTEGLVSYAFIKDFSFLKNASVVAGVHWDYLYMDFDKPEGTLTVSSDWLHFRLQTLAPIGGLSGTFKGFKKGIWGGDMHLSVLGGPIIWGHAYYKEVINNVNRLRYRGDVSHGYIVKALADVTILSGKITPTMEGSVALFVQFTKTDVDGTISCRDLSQPFVAPRDFSFGGGGTVGVIGLSAAISF
jgi:hypothetical protein